MLPASSSRSLARSRGRGVHLTAKTQSASRGSERSRRATSEPREALCRQMNTSALRASQRPRRAGSKHSEKAAMRVSLFRSGGGTHLFGYRYRPRYFRVVPCLGYRVTKVHYTLSGSLKYMYYTCIHSAPHYTSTIHNYTYIKGTVCT